MDGEQTAPAARSRSGEMGLFAILAALVLLLAAGAVYPLGQRLNYEPADSASLLSAIFSGLAFAAVIVTLRMQREELELQRQELADTRAEITRQREEMQAQNATLSLQRFENTFFEVVRLWRETADRTQILFDRTQYTGRSAFTVVGQELERQLELDVRSSREESYAEWVLLVVRGLALAPLSDFSPYLRTLERLLDLTMQRDRAEAIRYAQLAASQMTAAEQMIVAAVVVDERFKRLGYAVRDLDLLDGLVLPKALAAVGVRVDSISRLTAGR